MKRSTIIILILSMVFSFVGLIIIQARYVKVNAEMIENQFDESGHRSLLSTVILVEENEALEYLAQTLEGADYNKSLNLLPNLAQIDSDNLNQIDTTSRRLSSYNQNLSKPKIRISTR